jgi:hypothetical protein
MRFLAIAFLAHGGQHVTEDPRRALRLHIRFPSPLKRIDRALIAVLRCSSLSTVVMSASSTCLSRIRHHAALLSAADRCQLPRQLPRAQSFAIDYHLFSPVSRAFLCPQSLPGQADRLASRGTCGFFGGAVSGCVGCVPCAPLGELLLFRRSCLCRSLCAASGDLCLFLLSRGAVFCARCLAALVASLRGACVRSGSVVPTSAASGRRFVSQLFCRRAPRVGAFYEHYRLALRCSPVDYYLRPLVPLMCQLRWFCGG